MLQLTIPAQEFWDEKREEFVPLVKETTLQLEHSLVSISKWEAKHKKPFLSNNKMTEEEAKDYIKCMTITQNVDPIVYDYMPKKNVEEICDYIGDTMTATWFSDTNKQSKSDMTITSEIIYYQMIALNIPPEYQKWHINRLLTLIRVCNEKNKPQKKMPRDEILSRNKALNEARKRALNTKG